MVITSEKCAALKLLSEYRLALWRKSVLEAVSGEDNEALPVCLEQIRLTQELAETLKRDIRLGAKLYWVIFATFMTDKQPLDVNEILVEISTRYEHIPRRTYFRLKKQAIKKLNVHLKEMEKVEQ